MKPSSVDSCDGCGACCLEQMSPPGYVMFLSHPKMMDEAGEDVERLRNLPEDAMEELREYMKRLLAGEGAEGDSCIWLDGQSMRCRYHEHRPSICRDFKVGGEDCLGWRETYQIDELNL